MYIPERSNFGLHTWTDNNTMRVSCPRTLVKITSHDDREYTSKFKHIEFDCLSIFIATDLNGSQPASNHGAISRLTCAGHPDRHLTLTWREKETVHSHFSCLLERATELPNIVSRQHSTNASYLPRLA